mgnify:CR=1 FL=1
MGKTPKPLTILCHPDIAKWGEVQKLAEQGHTVVQDFMVQGQSEDHMLRIDLSRWDLILAPTAWHMTPKHRKYLPLAVAAARKQRYPKEK